MKTCQQTRAEAEAINGPNITRAQAKPVVNAPRNVYRSQARARAEPAINGRNNRWPQAEPAMNVAANRKLAEPADNASTGQLASSSRANCEDPPDLLARSSTYSRSTYRKGARAVRQAE